MNGPMASPEMEINGEFAEETMQSETLGSGGTLGKMMEWRASSSTSPSNLFAASMDHQKDLVMTDLPIENLSLPPAGLAEKASWRSIFGGWLGDNPPLEEKSLPHSTFGLDSVRRQPRKGNVGLPRSGTFKRQDSERRERLMPLEETTDGRRAATKIDTISPRSLSTKYTSGDDTDFGHARSLGDSERVAQWAANSATNPHPILTDKFDVVDNHGNSTEESDPHSASTDEVLDEEVRKELETKWILNLSMHFKDNSPREKFFVTYAENPSKWRKVTISCDYRNAAPDSLEQELEALLGQREKSASIYEAIRESLPDIQFYDTVTNLKLETREGRLHVHVTEDVNEIIPFEEFNSEQIVSSQSQSWSQKDGWSGAKEWYERASKPSRSSGQREKWARSIVQDIADITCLERELQQKWTMLNTGSRENVMSTSYAKILNLKLGDLPSSLKIGNADRVQSLDQYHTSTQKARLTKRKLGLVGFANGKDAAAMADTGSRENIISASYAKELGLKVKGSPSSFKIGNANRIQSLGIISLRWAFAENPKKRFSVLCHVLPVCTYNLILGNGFLSATETMSKFRHRLTKCLFSIINNVSHFGFLGETYQRLEGTIADTHQVFAIPDTGADRNVMSLQYAIDHGLEVQSEPKNRGYLQFADGTFDETEGQVETYWTFATGERIPVTFEVLRYCCSDVIIGEDILTEHNVFQEHAESIIWDMAFDADSYELAPFDFVNSWQRRCDRLIEKIGGKKNPSYHVSPATNAMIEEQQRRNVWNQKYDFGAEATTGEKELEKVRRERFKAGLLPGNVPSADNPHTDRGARRMPVIPSIPTSQA